MWTNNIIVKKNNLLVFTKGESAIELGELNIERVRRYKCPLQTVEVKEYEYDNGVFDAELPGKYIIHFR